MLQKIVIKLILKTLSVFKVDLKTFHNYYIHYLDRKSAVNRHLMNGGKVDKSYDFYIQYTPDRYSRNFALYRQQSNFLSYEDLNKWIAGNYNNNIGDLNRFYFLNLCLDQLLDENLTGDVVELGVYRGNSAFLLARFARRIHTNCYLFDTFLGFDAKDLTGMDKNTPTEAFKDTSLEQVRNLVGDENTVYVEGFFPDSLSQVGELKNLALVHLDCDLEKPMAAALAYFYPRMATGGFLVMHDYSSLYWPGAKKAIDEFFTDKKEQVILIPDKSGTCVIRKHG